MCAAVQEPYEATNRALDMELGGHVVQTGDKVVVWEGEANHDRQRFLSQIASRGSQHRKATFARFSLGR
jgi:hypothetical protein